MACALEAPVTFAPDCAKAQAAAASSPARSIVAARNHRFYPEEGRHQATGIDKADPPMMPREESHEGKPEEFAQDHSLYADCCSGGCLQHRSPQAHPPLSLPTTSMPTTKDVGYPHGKVQAVDAVLSSISAPSPPLPVGSGVTKVSIIENLADKVDNLILCNGAGLHLCVRSVAHGSIHLRRRQARPGPFPSCRKPRPRHQPRARR